MANLGRRAPRCRCARVQQLRLKRLRRCALGWDFVLTDAIGAGRVEQFKSPDGVLLRLVSAAAPT